MKLCKSVFLTKGGSSLLPGANILRTYNSKTQKTSYYAMKACTQCDYMSTSYSMKKFGIAPPIYPKFI